MDISMQRLSVTAVMGLLLLTAAGAVWAQGTMLAIGDGVGSPIGFSTVADARATLAAEPGVILRTNKDGWDEIEDRHHQVLWSFVPTSHPAYPAAVKRVVVGHGMAVSIGMDALCEAEREPCEALMKDLQRRNEIARNRFVRSPPRGHGARADVSAYESLLSRR
jgi:hypothetical protein